MRYIRFHFRECGEVRSEINSLIPSSNAQDDPRRHQQRRLQAPNQHRRRHNRPHQVADRRSDAPDKDYGEEVILDSRPLILSFRLKTRHIEFEPGRHAYIVLDLIWGFCTYWVRLKGFYMVVRFSANFSENCSEADSMSPWGSRGIFKTLQAF